MNAASSQARIVVMAKAPVAGAVNTRLIPRIGPEGAAELQRRLVSRTLARLTGEVPVELWCLGAVSHPFFAYCRRHFGVELRTQHGENLGERMFRALEAALKRARFVAVVGTDCPMLSGREVGLAFDALRNGADAAFLPVEDGGYGVVAVRAADPRLFRGIDWGGGTVMGLTRERLRALGWQWHELPVGWDVDRPEDLDRLPPELLTGIGRDGGPAAANETSQDVFG